MVQAESNWGGRDGGWLLVVATVLMTTGATIPFFSPSLREAPWSDVWEELASGIAGNPSAWRWANGLFLSAAVVTAIGLAGVNARFTDRARMFGTMGVVVFGLAAAMSVIDRTIAISVAPWAAREGLSSSNTTLQAFVRLDEGLNLLFFVLGFLAVVLFGLAIGVAMSSPTVGRTVSGVGLLGALLAFVGLAIPAFVYLTTFAIGVLAVRGRV